MVIITRLCLYCRVIDGMDTLDELERQDKQTGLITLCIGGGMGIATIIERV